MRTANVVFVRQSTQIVTMDRLFLDGTDHKPTFVQEGNELLQSGDMTTRFAAITSTSSLPYGLPRDETDVEQLIHNVRSEANVNGSSTPRIWTRWTRSFARSLWTCNSPTRESRPFVMQTCPTRCIPPPIPCTPSPGRMPPPRRCSLLLASRRSTSRWATR